MPRQYLAPNALRMDAQAIIAADMSEAQLLANVLDAAAKLGWLAYHTRDSRGSQEGFPDLVLVRRDWQGDVGRGRRGAGPAAPASRGSWRLSGEGAVAVLRHGWL